MKTPHGAMRALAALALAAVVACSEPAPGPGMGESAVAATDDTGRRVALSRPATRVVSLLPAATEILVELGAEDRVVGRTRYDRDPRLAAVPSVGGGLDPNLESIVALRPDLVVAWESPTGSRVRQRLEQLGIPVFAAATRDTATIYRTLAGLGSLVGRDAAADSVAGRLRAGLDSVRASVPPGPRPSVLYLISLDPLIISGTDNFIAELIGVAGGEPVAISAEGRGVSPQVSLEALIRLQPEVVLVPVGADPGMTVARLGREPGWRELSAVREGRVMAVRADLVRPSVAIGELAWVFRDALWGERP